MRLIVLDSGPLGLLTRPRHVPIARACATWLRLILDSGLRVTIPAVADYEVRRELTRLGSKQALAQLDMLGTQLGVIPISNEALRQASQFWAEARQSGRPTADPHALDGDVILAAQALLEAQPTEDLIVATTNVRHLGQFVTAMLWNEIKA
jgi:predicted nucleic acid-binding protein